MLDATAWRIEWSFSCVGASRTRAQQRSLDGSYADLSALCALPVTDVQSRTNASFFLEPELSLRVYKHLRVGEWNLESSNQ